MDFVTVPGTPEIDHVKKLEDEHLMLQRQFRCIQSERRNAALGVHPKHKRQVKLLRRLRKEYINLDRNLKIAKSGAHKKRDERREEDLEHALLEKETTSLNTKSGVLRTGELDVLLTRNMKHVLALRKKENANKEMTIERRLRSERRLAMMENRLEKAILRFDTVYFENMKMRNEIEAMLKDRANFNKAWQKMISALSTGKKYTTDLFEQSTLAYDQRDEWCSKLKSMMEKGKMDQLMQTQEMRELQNALDNDTALHDFLAIKGVTRVNKDQQIKEEEHKRKLKEQQTKTLEYHEKLLHEIWEYKGNDNPWEIIKDFKAVEEHNSSLYTLLTDICAEVQVMSRDVKKIQTQTKDRKDWNHALQDKLESKNIKLRGQLNDQKDKNAILKNRVDEQDRTLENVQKNIDEIFVALNCSLAPFENLLGDKKPSLRTAILSLDLITEKIKQHTSLVYYHEHHAEKTKKHDKFITSRLKKYTVFADPGIPLKPNSISKLVRANPCSVCVEARWLARVSDKQEMPISAAEAIRAGQHLRDDPAYDAEDWLHSLTECRLPRSRAKVALSYM